MFWPANTIENCSQGRNLRVLDPFLVGGGARRELPCGVAVPWLWIWHCSDGCFAAGLKMVDDQLTKVLAANELRVSGFICYIYIYHFTLQHFTTRLVLCGASLTSLDLLKKPRKKTHTLSAKDVLVGLKGIKKSP